MTQPTAADEPGPATLQRFQLVRDIDATGVSGTGVVVEGVRFTDGTVALRWLSKHTSTAIYASIDDVKKIHGHDGATRVVWLDWLNPPPTVAAGAWSTAWKELAGYVNAIDTPEARDILGVMADLMRRVLSPARPPTRPSPEAPAATDHAATLILTGEGEDQHVVVQHADDTIWIADDLMQQARDPSSRRQYAGDIALAGDDLISFGTRGEGLGRITYRIIGRDEANGWDICERVHHSPAGDDLEEK